jgi:hypothetical protein
MNHVTRRLERLEDAADPKGHIHMIVVDKTKGETEAQVLARERVDPAAVDVLYVMVVA